LNDDLTVKQMRADYLRDHPDGRFNRYIERGEVVRGMNMLEVSAAWGLPETRRPTEDREVEYWTYFSQDEITGDWCRYTLTFEDKAVSDWYVVRHFTKNGELTSWSHTETSGVATNPGVNSPDIGSTRR
jgi:hypothetical protein